MGDFDRRELEGSEDFLQIEIDKIGSIEIDRGDFLFLDRTDGLREKGTSTATFKVFPFDKISGASNTLSQNISLARDNFLGISAWHSDSGVTEKVGVYINGTFSYPIKNTKTVKPFYYATPCGSGTTLFNQKIAVEETKDNMIGIISDYGVYKSTTNILFQSKIMCPFEDTI